MTRARPVWLALALLWLVVLAIGLLMPEPYIPNALTKDFDDLAHVVLFAGVVALWGVALPRWAWLIGAGAVVLALGSEWAQDVLTHDRGAQWSDVHADLVGIVLGLVIALRAEAATRYANRRRVASTGRR